MPFEEKFLSFSNVVQRDYEVSELSYVSSCLLLYGRRVFKKLKVVNLDLMYCTGKSSEISAIWKPETILGFLTRVRILILKINSLSKM
jgi:hypothetical protein